MNDPDHRPNWVAEKDSCRPERLFEDLVEAVQSDVDAMQALPKKARQGCEFKPHPRDDGLLACTVYRLHPVSNRMVPKGSVNFHCLKGTVCLQPEGEEEMKVEAALDPETGLRVLTLEGKSVTLWQVSRRMLESLFFNFEGARDR